MIEIVETPSADDLADLRRDYLASLSAPLDGMWEAFAAMGRQLEIRSVGERAGYFSLNDQGQLLQFHVAEPLASAAAKLFAAVVARDEVKGAMVSTADPLFLGVCLDIHKTLRVHTYLYRDHHRRAVALEGAAETSFELVEANELEAIAELQRESLDQDLGDWLIGYLERLIARRELYALRLEGEILATGEARQSESQPPFVDLGVITVRRHRGRGVASQVLGRLKQLCYERELVPICSTTVENAGARRAIAKAGFVSRHRLLEVVF
ncbi:MAG: GNAT family N-acetyltransferase [Thermoanaerobaculia bacterium]